MIPVSISRIVPPILWKLGVTDTRSHVANLASERAGNAFDGQVPKKLFVSAEDLSGTSDRKDVADCGGTLAWYIEIVMVKSQKWCRCGLC